MTTIQIIRQQAVDSLQSPSAYLLPLRLFIGLGWLRAGTEKLIDPNWLNGTVLESFLTEHLVNGDVYFPLYEAMIQDVFLPSALVFSWVIMIGQFMVGLGISTGTFTNAALLGGLFMNVNFVLAGAVNPSAFYIVIQVALLVGSAGSVFGLDAYLSERFLPRFAATNQSYAVRQWGHYALLVLALVSWGLMITTIPFIRDYGPHSVDDPAMLMTILLSLGGLTAFIMYGKAKLVQPKSAT